MGLWMSWKDHSTTVRSLDSQIKQTDGGIVVVSFKKLVHGCYIEIQLSCKFGFKFHCLEFNDHIALEPYVIKYHIRDERLSSRHPQFHLTSYERESLPQFKQEFGNVPDKLVFKLYFIVTFID